MSCSTEEEYIHTDITLETTKKTLYKGEKFQLKAISDLPLTYQSENDFHATVSTSGLLQAEYVGKTNIVISNNENTQSVNITVAPKSALYPEPLLDFTLSKTEVISLLGTPDEETETAITYNNYSEASPSITYSFNEKSIIKSVSVTVKNSYYSTLTNTHLNERYRFSNVFNDVNVGNVFEYHNSLNNITPSLVVFLYSTDSVNYIIRYIPYTESEETKLKYLRLS
ncbi:hypothetical protein [Wenyingzhuangia sp. IMCC45467]